MNLDSAYGDFVSHRAFISFSHEKSNQINIYIYINSEVSAPPNETLPICTGPQLGYTLPDSLIDLTGAPQLINALLEVILVVLIFHPISAVLSLLTLLPALLLGHHASEVLALIMAIVTALFTSLSCGIDLGVSVVARSQVPSFTNHAYEVCISSSSLLNKSIFIYTPYSFLLPWFNVTIIR